MTVAKIGGRPLKFESPEILQEKIDAYFEKIKKNNDIPTVTELAYELGTSRKILVEYQGRIEYCNAINRAKAKIEIFWEKSLLTPKVTAGVAFNLKNNFGWKDKTEVDSNVTLKSSLDERLLAGRQKAREALEKQKKDDNKKTI